MSGKVYNASVFLDLISITCPGVWLCPKGKVFVKICLFGVADLSKEVDPFFPLVFKERFNFQRVFKNLASVHELYDRIGRSIISMDILQCPVGSSGCIHLAAFNALLSDILHPYSTCFSKPQNTSGIELLFTATKNFPGIIAPKADISTKVKVSDSLDDKAGISPQKTRSRSTVEVGKRRQVPVCHTKDNLNCKCFRTHENSKIVSKPNGKFDPEELNCYIKKPLNYNLVDSDKLHKVNGDDDSRDLEEEQSFQTPSTSSTDQRPVENTNGRRQRERELEIANPGNRRQSIREEYVDGKLQPPDYRGDYDRLTREPAVNTSLMEKAYQKKKMYTVREERGNEPQMRSVDHHEYSSKQYRSKTFHDMGQQNHDSENEVLQHMALGGGHCSCIHPNSLMESTEAVREKVKKISNNADKSADRNRVKLVSQQYKHGVNPEHVDEYDRNQPKKPPSHKLYINPSSGQEVDDSQPHHGDRSLNWGLPMKSSHPRKSLIGSPNRLHSSKLQKQKKKAEGSAKNSSNRNKIIPARNRIPPKCQCLPQKASSEEPVDENFIIRTFNETQDATIGKYVLYEEPNKAPGNYLYPSAVDSSGEHQTNTRGQASCKKFDAARSNILKATSPIQKYIDYRESDETSRVNEEDAEARSDEEYCDCQLCNRYQLLYNPKVHPCPRFKREIVPNNSKNGQILAGRKKIISSRLPISSRSRLSIPKILRGQTSRNPSRNTP